MHIDLGRRLARSSTVLAAVAILAACYPAAGPAPGPLAPNTVAAASTRWPGVTASSLSSGHDLFVARCNGCHAYPDTSAIGDDRWPSIMNKMGPKAHLDETQKGDVLHYVLAWRSQP